MKLRPALLFTIGAIATGTAAAAQETNSGSGLNSSSVNLEPASKGAVLLQTQPAVAPQPVIRIRTNSPRTGPSLYKKVNLNQVSDSLQVGASKPRAVPLIPQGVQVPDRQTTVDPLGFFRVPPLDSGVKVRVNQ